MFRNPLGFCSCSECLPYLTIRAWLVKNTQSLAWKEYSIIVSRKCSRKSQLSSFQFSHSVVSDSLQPYESQPARPPCPPPTPGVHSDLCLSSQWYHPAISSSVIPFSFCPQSLPASGSFPMNQLFTSGGQSIGVSDFNIIPSNEHPGLIPFRMDWLDLLAVQGTLQSWLQHHSSKASIFQCSAFFIGQLSHPYMTTGKTIALTRWTFVGKVMSLLLNMLSMLVITFLPRSKCIVTSWLQSPSAVIFGTPKNKAWHCFQCFPIYFPWSDGTRCHELSFLNVEL